MPPRYAIFRALSRADIDMSYSRERVSEARERPPPLFARCRAA